MFEYVSKATAFAAGISVGLLISTAVVFVMTILESRREARTPDQKAYRDFRVRDQVITPMGVGSVHHITTGAEGRMLLWIALAPGYKMAKFYPEDVEAMYRAHETRKIENPWSSHEVV